MNIFFIKLIQLIIALSTLIAIHELGHFLIAKLFKIKVDKFFLFFDLNGYKLLSTKSGWFSKLFPKLKNLETEYGIGWLPLGGYCKICGMIDESLNKDELSSEPKEWEFRSKPAWQRFWVMFGGVMFNFIFAIIIFILIMNIWGQTYISSQDNNIYVNKLAYEMGFRNGDKILQYDNFKPNNFAYLQANLARKEVKKVKVLRGKDTINIYIDQNNIAKILNTPNMFQVAVPLIIDTIPPSSPNYNLGIKKGDRIIQVNGEKTAYLQDFKSVIEKHKGEKLQAEVIRNGDTLKTEIKIDTSGRANIYSKIPNVKIKKYNIITAIPAGIKLTYSTISGYLNDLKLVAQPSTGAYKSVGSFISIGRIFPSQWNWYGFLYIMALLSIMLGVMNLLPIPALDGGHIMFLFYEMLTGRKPSEKVLTIAQIIGMFILILLAFYACGNDIIKLIN